MCTSQIDWYTAVYTRGRLMCILMSLDQSTIGKYPWSSAITYKASYTDCQWIALFYTDSAWRRYFQPSAVSIVFSNLQETGGWKEVASDLCSATQVSIHVHWSQWRRNRIGEIKGAYSGLHKGKTLWPPYVKKYWMLRPSLLEFRPMKGCHYQSTPSLYHLFAVVYYY